MTTARRGLARVRSRKRERGDKRRGAEPEGAERFACVCALGEGGARASYKEPPTKGTRSYTVERRPENGLANDTKMSYRFPGL